MSPGAFRESVEFVYRVVSPKFNLTHPHTSSCMHTALQHCWLREIVFPDLGSCLPSPELLEVRVEIGHIFHLIWNNVAPFMTWTPPL
jgi:hypothetical protein